MFTNIDGRYQLVNVCLNLAEMSEKVMKEWSLDVPWGKLAMLSWGDPSLQPVLMIHGFVDTAATFLPLVAAMPASYYYVTFDLPGHGRSDSLPGPPISPLHLVEAVRQIVDQLHWDTFYCVAHSMGFLISAFYNAAYPGRIRRLVGLAGAVSLQVHGLVDHPVKWFDICYASYYKRYCPPPPPISYTYEEAVKSLATARRVSEEHAAGLATRCLESVDGRVRFTWDVKAKKIFVPPIYEDMVFAVISTSTSITLCIVPTEDETTITFSRYHENMLARLAGEGIIVHVPGGHSVHLTNPEIVVPHIVRFLNEDSIKSKL